MLNSYYTYDAHIDLDTTLIIKRHLYIKSIVLNDGIWRTVKIKPFSIILSNRNNLECTVIEHAGERALTRADGQEIHIIRERYGVESTLFPKV